MSEPNDPALEQFYDALGESAETAFARGEVKVDPHLQNREADRRRGLTVILRLAPQVAEAIGAFIDELKRVEPKHYFYTPMQCHVTVLSLQTATSEYVHEPEIVAAYAAALDEAIKETPPFAIRFEGITATPEAVLIRGFPEHNALNQMREKIFDTMAARELPVKQRYMPTAAHVTVMRFSQPSFNLAALTDFLRSNRTQFFGTSAIRKVEMVENDWYISPDRVRPLRSFPLGPL